MCGIFGFNWRDKKFLKEGLEEIRNRGPDDSGVFFDEGVSLGHDRLSIIDLSKLGRQPMSNENGDIWVTFNGEIYNYKELKEKLKKKHKFKSNTDTEVLLHLYEEEGVDLVNKLQGMFAFAIYDSKKKIFFLARDRVGIKPLYYYAKNKKFVFCSELRGILKDKKIKRELNHDALHSYFTFRANTGEDTFLKNIKKVLPGNYLIYDLKNKKIKIKKYWDIKFSPEYKKKASFKKKLRELLEDSVRARLMSDVPYGVYLSGGVDSGTIASLVKKFSKSNKPIKTFSVGFENEEHVETDEAKFLAEKLGTDHHELLIKEDSVKELPNIIYNAGEPLADPTAIPIYFLSKYAKKHCTVILTGEGADEIFAGYPQYKFMKLHNTFLRKTPKTFRKILPALIKKSPKFLVNKGFRFASALGDKGIERFSNFALSNSYSEQYLNQISIFNEQEQKALLGKKISLYENYKTYFEDPKSNNLINNCKELDFKEPMVEDLLMKVDKNTMAFSVEGRVPFLDHRIVELAAKIPENMNLKGFTKDKNILREAVKDLVPAQTQKRKKKHFFVPIDSWFKNELATLRNQLLSEEYIKKQKIFNYSYIKKMNSGFEKSKLFYSRQLWALIVFQIWYKQYIENEKVKFE